MGTQPLSQKGADPPPQFSVHFYCGQTAGCINLPLGMDVGLSPGHFVLVGDPVTSPHKGGGVPQILGPCLLWPNGWMDEDATWHKGRPQPRRLCVRWGPSPLTQKGRSPIQFSAHVYCGQTAAWIKMPLGTEVDLGLRDIVFDMDLATPRKRAHPPHPIFGPCLL